MRAKINSFSLAKVFIAVAMLSFGIYQIIITSDEKFVANEASLLEAYSETHTFYSQERHQTKTRYYFQYQYAFNDKDYISGRYTHVYLGSSLGVERFSGAGIGTKFTIYVNPDNPSYAVIQKGRPLFIYALAITGLFGVLNCLLEWWLDKLHTSNLVNSQQRLEQVRKYLKTTGAMTAIGIFVTAFMCFFVG